MRVFALSDIHVDYDGNARWVMGLSMTDYQQDLLILAGDVSDDMSKIAACLSAFARRFAKVLFIPGNHELWVTRDLKFADSMAKFVAVLDLVRECGASTDVYVGPGLSVVPLFGWYDYSFGKPSDELRKAWTDFHACRWPPGWSDPEVSDALLSMNEGRRGASDGLVISFSHFLPRIDVMPNYVPEAHRLVYPVLGSTGLERQIRALGSTIHVYGHSHVNQRIQLEGVEYINNAFGYPREKRVTAKSLLCVHDSQTARGLTV